MQFMITAHDGAGKLPERMRIRPQHLENIERVRGEGHVLCAGGLFDEEGALCGSMLVLEYPDRAGLDAYLASEPYVTGKVWEDIRVERMNVVVLNNEKTVRA